MPTQHTASIDTGASPSKRIDNKIILARIFFHNFKGKFKWEHRVVGAKSCPAGFSSLKTFYDIFGLNHGHLDFSLISLAMSSKIRFPRFNGIAASACAETRGDTEFG